MLELEMVTKGYEYLAKKKEYKIIKREVPFLSRCIDMVLINKNDEIFSIEFKINNWKHAIEQAMNHMLGADEAYICLPKRKISPQLYKYLHETGIGLFFFDIQKESMFRVIPAVKKNNYAFKKLLITNVNKL